MSRLIDADALMEKEERYELDRYIDGERCYEMAVPSSAIIEAPTIDAVSEWIPCSERMPSEGELVLVSNPYISGVGYYRNRHWYIANNVSWDAWSITDVAAWMPLPKPYREREGE